jgi:thioredoxin-dependent peroxiredoxin
MNTTPASHIALPDESGHTHRAGRITDGEPAKGFEVEDMGGQPVRLADYAGRHVLLSFFRFASCPYCNLRVHRMIERYPTYRAQGLEMIAVFESPRESLQRYVGKQQAPFPIIGDPANQLYRLYAVERSWWRLVKTFLTPRSAVTTMREGTYASMVKGFRPGKIDAGIHRMPADFLIGPDQVVLRAYYGAFPGDHLPFAEIERVLPSVPASRTDAPTATFCSPMDRMHNTDRGVDHDVSPLATTCQ